MIVDDASPDASWRVTKQLASRYPVRAIRLSRNFGQHAAIRAGLEATRGDIVVVMDCDLQDPPEMIPLLTREVAAGSDVVFARRSGDFDKRSRRAASRAYAWTMRRLTGADIDPGTGSFSALSRDVVTEVSRMRDLDQNYLFVLLWLGYEMAFVDYERPPREAGESSYSFRKRLALGLRGLIFFSRLAIRAVIATGFVVFLFALITTVILFLLRGPLGTPPGWVSIMMAVLLVGGLNLSALGIVGLYVARVYEQASGRPLYVVHEDTERLPRRSGSTQTD